MAEEKEEVWEYDGQKWRHCPKCKKTILFSWQEHKACGWVKDAGEIVVEETTTPPILKMSPAVFAVVLDRTFDFATQNKLSPTHPDYGKNINTVFNVYMEFSMEKQKQYNVK